MAEFRARVAIFLLTLSSVPFLCHHYTTEAAKDTVRLVKLVIDVKNVFLFYSRFLRS